jgi:phage FluMu protein gp41
VYERALRQQVDKGAMIKVIVDWQDAEMLTERFWIEITKVIVGANGQKQYWGKVRNNTQVATVGDVFGPVMARNICGVDAQFVEQLKHVA